MEGFAFLFQHLTEDPGWLERQLGWLGTGKWNGRFGGGRRKCGRRHGRSRWLTARAASYAAVWLVLVSTVCWLLVSRRDLDVLILRQPGTLYTNVTGGDVANFYNIQAFNRTDQPTRRV